MYCKKCGNEIDVSDKFCTYCGASNDMANTNVTIQNQPNVVPNTTNNKKLNVCALLGFIFSIIGFCGLASDTVDLSNLFTIAGLVLSIIGLVQTIKKKNIQRGKPFAIAGLSISGVAIALTIVLAFFSWTAYLFGFSCAPRNYSSNDYGYHYYSSNDSSSSSGTKA